MHIGAALEQELVFHLHEQESGRQHVELEPDLGPGEQGGIRPLAIGDAEARSHIGPPLTGAEVVIAVQPGRPAPGSAPLVLGPAAALPQAELRTRRTVPAKLAGAGDGSRVELTGSAAGT